MNDPSSDTRRSAGMSVGKILSVIALVGVCLLAAPVNVPSGASAAPDRDITDQVLTDLKAGKFMILRYDNCRGTIESQLAGDAGSTSNLTAQFDGLYVVCEPVLTHLLHRGGPMSSSICDLYHIYPQRLTIRSHGKVTQYVEPGMTYEWTWKRTRSMSLPAPPTGTLAQAAVGMWKKLAQAKMKEVHMRALFLLSDRRAAGGTVTVQPSALIGDPNGTTLTITDAAGKVTTLANPLGHLVQSKRTGPPAVVSPSGNPAGVTHWWNVHRTELQGEAKDFSLLDLTFAHRRTIVGQAQQILGKHPKNDQLAKARVFYSIGLVKEVDAELAPVGGDENYYMPKPDDKRKYRLTINEPEISEVEAIRFYLSGVSKHEGIACNARVHVLSPIGSCGHCIDGRQDTSIFDEVSFGGMRFDRVYYKYNDCKADELPDLYFTNTDNSGTEFELGDNAIRDPKMKYDTSAELIVKAPTRKQYTVTVCVMDGAAAGRLKAELLVGGAWKPATATGDTADSENLALLIPNDQNDNGVADAWEQSGGGDMSADNDSSLGGEVLGDGLTVKEEYRGFYIQKKFTRLEPETQDLFAHDYAGQYGPALQQVKGWYDNCGMKMHIIHSDEFLRDVVNWTRTDVRRHDQYQIVVMKHNMLPLGDDTAANRKWIDRWGRGSLGLSAVTWPRKDHHVIIIRSTVTSQQSKARILAHEFGHQLNVHHHGDTDEIVEITGLEHLVPDGKHYVAVRGGEHSGHHLCFMRYDCADLFCDDDSVKTPYWFHKGKYSVFTPVDQKTFTEFCKDPKGTGFNANAWCRDAKKGACRMQIRIRSE